VTGKTIRRAAWALTLALCTIAGCHGASDPLPVIRARPSSPGTDQVEARFGSGGGTLSLVGGASVSIPAGALSKDTHLAIFARDVDSLAPLPAGLQAVSRAFSFLPVTQTFQKQVAMQLAYRQSADGMARLQVLRLDQGRDRSWEAVESSSGVGVARISTLRFGIYVVAGERLPDEPAFDAALPVPDGSVPEAGVPEAGLTDAARPDGGPPDAAPVDDAGPEAGG